ncbi:MAG: DNA replication and repair protein RecF [Ignavibacteria bacterium]|nr:DNA replication and repair protein RecF [Ignavibacteria bacterium]
MVLEHLTLKNFRNYRECSLNFGTGINFLYGDNGNGKTNLLEAISLLSYTRSFLNNLDSDCIYQGESYFEACGIYNNESGLRSKVLCRFSVSGKEFIHNNDKVNRFSTFLGEYPLVVFSPRDIKMTMGVPSERRKNFDMLIAQTSSVYLNDLRNYSRIIKQKNSLLRENKFTPRYQTAELRKMIEIWNGELAETAVKIIIRRLDFIETFRKILDSSFRKLINKNIEPIIRYECEYIGDDSVQVSPGEIKATIIETLRKKMEREISRGISLSGPHRDNYIFEMKKDDIIFDVKGFASQGEHKTFIIALKLSEYDYIRTNIMHTFKGNPILLLDDIFSELDDGRTEKICESMSDYGQVFITSPRYRYLDVLKEIFKGEISVFKVAGGTVKHV